jgi:hypothetical protein
MKKFTKLKLWWPLRARSTWDAAFVGDFFPEGNPQTPGLAFARTLVISLVEFRSVSASDVERTGILRIVNLQIKYCFHDLCPLSTCWWHHGTYL